MANSFQCARIPCDGQIQKVFSELFTASPDEMTFALDLREALFGLNPTGVYLIRHVASQLRRRLSLDNLRLLGVIA